MHDEQMEIDFPTPQFSEMCCFSSAQHSTASAHKSVMLQVRLSSAMSLPVQLCFGPLRHANRKKAGAAALGLPSALNIQSHAYDCTHLSLLLVPSHAQHDWSETLRIASPFWRGKPGASFHLVAYTVFFVWAHGALVAVKLTARPRAVTRSLVRSVGG